MTEMKRILGCLSACMIAGGVFAQNTPSTTPAPKTDYDVSATGRAAHHSQQFSRSKDLVGADVKDSSGQKLGDIKELLINHQSGQTFAAIGIGHSKDAIVPLAALSVTPAKSAFRNAEVTMNKTKADLEAGPVVANNEWHQLDDAAFTQRIYSYYKVQAPTAAGGTGTGADTTSGTTPAPDKEPLDKQ